MPVRLQEGLCPWQGRAFPALPALSLPFPCTAMPRIAKIPQFRCLLGMNRNLQSLAVPKGTLGAGDAPNLAPRGLVTPPKVGPSGSASPKQMPQSITGTAWGEMRPISGGLQLGDVQLLQQELEGTVGSGDLEGEGVMLI